MDSNEAAAALADVGRTEQRLAERAHWPFYRHAMFGLAEGLLVAGVAQPMGIAVPMWAGAMALVVVCIADDRRRHGMFVSGWQTGATLPLTLALFAFLLILVLGAALVRDGEADQPIGYLLGTVAFAVSTAASLRWQTIYRAELAGERRP